MRALLIACAIASAACGSAHTSDVDDDGGVDGDGGATGTYVVEDFGPSTCEGVVDPTPAGATTCRSNAECVATGPSSYALCVLQVSACTGSCPSATIECSDDSECGEGLICELHRPACRDCGYLDWLCVPDCRVDASACSRFQRCDDDGRCRRRSCMDDPTICAEGTTCTPDGCMSPPCSSDADCRVNWTCRVNPDGTFPAGADDRGCVRRECSRDADCDCGACVAGTCRQHAGWCEQSAA